MQWGFCALLRSKVLLPRFASLLHAELGCVAFIDPMPKRHTQYGNYLLEGYMVSSFERGTPSRGYMPFGQNQYPVPKRCIMLRIGLPFKESPFAEVLIQAHMRV